jgi:hypothetical protein
MDLSKNEIAPHSSIEYSHGTMKLPTARQNYHGTPKLAWHRVNIVQEVASSANSMVRTIVGNYLTNMTYTGQSQTLQNGLVQKTYSYSPLNALVNIVFNAAGQIVQATVAK